MATIRPFFKIHGGKRYLCKWIIDNFPPDYEKMNYLEPYCGAASVFLNKKRSLNETINDIDNGVVCIFNTLCSEPEEFATKLRCVKYEEKTFNDALVFDSRNQLKNAVNEFILRRMSRGGMKKAFAWSNRQRGGKPGDVNAWETALKLIPSIAARLQGVEILNRKAIDVIREYNRENVLLYCDPTYLPETRTSKKVYTFEMTLKDHEELGKELNSFRGKVVLSGYMSTLYGKMYSNWNVATKQVANHSSQQKKKTKKTEVLWFNF